MLMTLGDTEAPGNKLAVFREEIAPPRLFKCNRALRDNELIHEHIFMHFSVG